MIPIRDTIPSRNPAIAIVELIIAHFLRRVHVL
jgi:hypothetical protein